VSLGSPHCAVLRSILMLKLQLQAICIVTMAVFYWLWQKILCTLKCSRSCDAWGYIVMTGSIYGVKSVRPYLTDRHCTALIVTNWYMLLLSHRCRVGQNHIYTVCIRYFWQGNHRIYGQIRCIHTVLANPTHRCFNLQLCHGRSQNLLFNYHNSLREITQH